MDAEEQLLNESSDGSLDTIDLTAEDIREGSVEEIHPLVPRMNGDRLQNANHDEVVIGVDQNEHQVVDLEEVELQSENEDDDLIIEEQPRRNSTEMQDALKIKQTELFSWFKKLKVEHITEFKAAGNQYFSEYVGEEPFLPVDQCEKIASDYKESGSLNGLAEKWDLENDELLIAAICIGIFENNNSFDIDFGILGDERLDNYSIEHGQKYFKETLKKNSPVSPLKFMQFTVTSPASAMILLTYLHMLTNGFPCQFALDHDPGEFAGDIDLIKMANEIVDTSIKYWGERKEAIRQNAHEDMTKELNDFFHEIEATSSEMKEHFKTTLGQHSEVMKLKENKVPPVEVPDVFDEQLLSKEAREELVRAKATMDLLAAESAKFATEARKVYANKLTIEQLHALKPGDFCLARTINTDSADLKYAMVDKVLSAETYRVKFMTSNKLAECHIRDMALTNHGLCNPIYSATGLVGLRVAVYVPQRLNQFHQKWQWETGTIASRRFSNKGEFLVFFDTGNDAYASAPVDIGDAGYAQVVAKAVGAPVSFQDILTRMKAAKIAVMVGQPIGASGALDKRLSHVWIRDKNRADYIKHYMEVYPEFWLLKMPIGKVTYLCGIPPDKRRQRVTVVGQNRSFAIVRPQRDSMRVGYNCLEYPCSNAAHLHDDDMTIYRGSARFADGSLNVRESMLANSNNNLSRRKKGQIAAGFELAESSRVMPQRVDSHQAMGVKPSAPAPRLAQEDKTKTQAEIEQRKKKQALYQKSVIRVPYIPPTGGISPHAHCGPDCLLKMDVSPYDPMFHRNSPLHTPILCGWKRLKYTLHNGKKRSPVFKKLIAYTAPCGKPLETMEEISKYLLDTRSLLSIDCFSFATSVDTETYITVEDKYVKMPDLSQGIEGIPIPLVNSVDDEPDPKLEYCKRRFPYNQTVDISSISQDFCSGCSCEGDCSQNENCECQMLSKQSAERLPRHLQYENNKRQASMYSNRMLPNKVITGVYECNDKCKCKRDVCHNRVVQNNIKYPVHIFKTAQSGWGCRALTDIPDGAFVCTYVGALLTNELADQLQNDDQYFADLDLKDAVEILKVREDHDTDMGYGGEESNDEEFSDTGLDDEEDDANDKNVVHRDNRNRVERPKRVTRRDSQEEKVGDASLGVDGKPEKKKDEPVFNWDDYFDKSALFVVDAKVRGNIGRFLNHSCAPNCIVQHVMYDTHDLRLPWVAFFTAHPVKAGDELTWDYQYTVNAEQPRLKCHCGAETCRNHLL